MVATNVHAGREAAGQRQARRSARTPFQRAVLIRSQPNGASSHLVDEVADALERLGDLDRRQRAQRCVVDLERALDFAVDDQAPVVGLDDRIAAPRSW